MTMISTRLVKIARDAIGNLERYANRDGYNDDFIEKSYRFADGCTHDIYRSFSGKTKEMDWASWLKVTDKKEIMRICEGRKITKLTCYAVDDPLEIRVSDLSDDAQYGIFDVELY